MNARDIEVGKRTAELVTALRGIDEHPSVGPFLEEAQSVERMCAALANELDQVQAAELQASRQADTVLDGVPLARLNQPLGAADLVTRDFAAEGSDLRARLAAAKRRLVGAAGALEEAREARRQSLLREIGLLHLELQRNVASALQAIAAIDQERVNSEREIRGVGGQFPWVFITGLMPMGISLQRLAIEGANFEGRLDGQARDLDLYYPQPKSGGREGGFPEQAPGAAIPLSGPSGDQVQGNDSDAKMASGGRGVASRRRGG